MSLTEQIKHKALQSGFDLVGITDASPIDARQVEFIAGWLKAGFAGQMNYMHRNFEKRTNPAKLLENAQSVICLGLNYTSPKTKLKPPNTADPEGRVANYAQYEDYHSFMKKQLRKLVDFIVSLIGDGHKFKICVDSAPVAERALAVRAGLGFIGKNHILINPEFGPQILLGEVITTLKLETDEPVTTNCAHCNKCIEACPTGALRGDGRLDANKCISYLTIEHRDSIPPDLAKKIGDRLFGCDQCILACPYQEDAPICKSEKFKFYNDRMWLDLQNILDLSAEDFKRKFADSPIERLGLEHLKRNARICLANITR